MLGPRQTALAAALVSGKYPQGYTTLCHRKDDGTEEYCCLGIACEVAIELGLPLEKAYIDGARIAEYGNPSLDERSTGVLPGVVKRFFGFYSISGMTKPGPDSPRTLHNDPITLTFLNDIKQLPFTEIEAFIQEHHELIFEEPL